MLKQRYIYLNWLALAVVIVYLSLVSMGDFRVRQSVSASSDDNPIFYANFYNQPQRYVNDIIYKVMEFKAPATSMNWLPIVLSQLLDINAEIVTWVLVFLQSALLCFAMYLLSLSLTGSHLSAWLSTFFVFAVRPWEWDLGVNLVSLAVAYPAYLALPLILLAMLALFKERLLISFSLFVLAGLTHPSLVLYMVPVLGLYWLIEIGLKDWRKLLLRYAGLIGLTIVCVAPGLLIQSNVENVLAIDSYMEAVRNNVHMAPWMAYPHWLNVVFNFLGLLPLILLSLPHFRTLSSKYAFFLISLLIVTVTMIPIQFLAVELKISPLIQLIPFRVSRLLLVFSMPAVVSYLLAKFQSERLLVRFAAVLIIVTMSFYNSSLLWISYLVLFTDAIQGNRLPFLKHPAVRQALYYLSCVLLIYWVIANVSSFRPGIPFVFLKTERSPYFYLIGFCLVLALAAYIPRFWSGLNMKQISRFMALPALLVALLYFSFKEANVLQSESYSAESRAIYEAQIWVNQNTPADAEFVIHRLPFRTYAERAAIEASVNFKFVYTRDGNLAEYNTRLLNFYGLEEAYNMSASWRDYLRTEARRYRNMNEDRIMAFSQEFGGDYIIFERRQEPLSFELVYQNRSITIYRIPELAVEN